MRRKDREITDFDEMLEIMQECDVCCLGLNNDGYPYLLPLNYAVKVTDGAGSVNAGGAELNKKVELYFHGALEGTKYELMAKDSRAGFEMDCEHELFLDDEKKSCSMAYKSVVGRGRVTLAGEDEKLEALRMIMAHYRHEDFPFGMAAVPRTNIFKLTVESMTAKSRRKPQH